MGVHFKQATIIGVGLVGGSLAGAMKARGIASTVVGVGRDRDNLENAVRLRLIDRYTHDPKKGVSGSDIVVLCCPVGMFEDVVREVKPYLLDQAIVTDVGSVKGQLVRRLEEILYLKARYVAAHPIAGSEKSGAGHANVGLFQGARCIVTPTGNTETGALQSVTAMWEGVGAVVERMDPDEHDRVFALVSHLPHMAAYALVGALAAMDGGERAITFAAGGFKDFTRIAGSEPSMWRDICLLNGPNIVEALTGYQEALSKLKMLINNGDGPALAEEFRKAQAIRKKIE